MEKIFAVVLSICIIMSALSIGGSAFNADEKEPLNSWVQKGDDWWYYDEYGNLAKGWKNINGHSYWFGEDGKMCKSAVTPDGYVCNHWGAVANNSWVKVKGEYTDEFWYYAGANGKPVKGWQWLNNNYYFFEEIGIMSTGPNLDGSLCSNGGAYVRDGWVWAFDEWYYARDGKAVTGWQWLNGAWYYFSNSYSGMMITNYAIDGYWVGADGKMDKNQGWKYSYDGWRYVGGNGKLAYGWTWVDGKYQFFDSYSYILSENPNRYDAAENPHWEYSNGTWYFYEDDGVKSTGGTTPDGYVVDEYGALRYNSWIWTGYDWLYTGGNGMPLDGWQWIDGKWYYFHDYYKVDLPASRYDYSVSNDGYIIDSVTNDILYNQWTFYAWMVEYYHYVGSNGKAVTGWQWIDGAWYHFDANGFMDHDVVYDGYVLGEDGKLRYNTTVTINKNDPYMDAKDYYVDGNGKFVTGLHDDGKGNTVYYRVDGIADYNVR